MGLLRGIIAGGVRNPILVNLMTLCFAAGGYFALRGMSSEAFPQIHVDHIGIEVVYPGAGVEDVERSICIPIEEAVEGLDGIKQISSSANENLCSVWLGLHSRVDPAKKLNEVKDRIDQVTTFPDEALKPVITEKVIRTEVINVAIYGDVPEATLKRMAEEVKTDLTSGTDITQVALLGVRDEEIIIELSHEALAAYNLTLAQVMAVVAKSNVDLPAGVLRTAGEEVTLRIAGQRFRADEFEDMIVLEHGDATVRLRDVAVVREGFEDAVTRGRFNGRPAAVAAVYKTPEQDTMRIAAHVREYVAARQPHLPERLHMSIWGDSSLDVVSRSDFLISNGLQGLVLLFVTLSVFLGFRYAFWVAADIPLCFAGALIVMSMLGMSLNMISLFALIIVAGIIVDDSIVIAESIHARRKSGDTPELAAIEGTRKVSKPVIAATLTTVIAFVPLMYVSGVMGKFVYPIAVVVIGALAASTFDAFCILPSHLCRRERSEKGGGLGQNRIRQWIDRTLDSFVVKWYRPLYRRAIDHRWVTLSAATAVLLISVGYVAGGHLPFVLLPKEDGNILRARVRFPEGAPASLAERTIDRLEQAAWSLNDDPSLTPAVPGKLVRQVYSIAGEFVDFLSIRGNNLCEVRLELMPPEQRRLDDDLIIAQWRRRVGPIADAVELTMSRQQLGPTDRPIEIRLLGQDLEDLSEASRRIQEKLREFGGVTDVHDDLIPGKRELRVDLQPAARALGLTLDDVARQLRYGFHGGEAVKLRRGRDEVTVRVRFPEQERRSIGDLENLFITTPDGHEVPFREIARVLPGRGYAQVMHQDGRRRVRVFADLDERAANAEQILHELEGGFLQEVVGDYNDMTLSFGGDRQAIDESMTSLSNGFWIGMAVMYTMMAAMLRSYVQPLIIFVTVPFGFIGVVVGHVCLGYDLTMMSLFGLVALSGIVVDHAIIILDAVHDGLREGKTLREAVFEAGETRFNAVVLSAITDVAGLLPLLSSPHGQAQSVMPMAISFSFGLVFSAAVTLFVVPAVYVALNDGRRLIRWLRRGGAYPAPEAVEESVHDHGLAVA